MISAGLSGLTLTHGDIAGYTAIELYQVTLITRSEELTLRWIELGTFTSVFRSHIGTLIKSL